MQAWKWLSTKATTIHFKSLETCFAIEEQTAVTTNFQYILYKRFSISLFFSADFKTSSCKGNNYEFPIRKH